MVFHKFWISRVKNELVVIPESPVESLRSTQPVDINMNPTDLTYKGGSPSPSTDSGISQEDNTPPTSLGSKEVQRPSSLPPFDESVVSLSLPYQTPTVLSQDELALLAKLEAANKLIETDVKALNTLAGISNCPTHSRRNSDTSQVSVNSVNSSSHDRSQAPEDVEEDQWTLWGHLVRDWEENLKKRQCYLKDMARKGIPHHFRGAVWPLLCRSHDSPAKKRYSELIRATSACEKVIRRDIARTYPEHDFFKEKDGVGQESLFNVMKAYSLYDREVGYCQGSAFIVGLLLMQMPEEEAFAVLVKLMQEYRLREMFKPSMAELGLCVFQLKHLVEEFLPDLYVHFESQGFDTPMYASSWFLTLFTTNLTLPAACRIMDAFLVDGLEVIFRVSLAILQSGKQDLLSLDMEGMLKYFQKETPQKFDAQIDGFMNLAYGFKYSVKKMRKLEKEYAAHRAKELEDQEEVRRLRAENRLLRQKVSMLETESSELADRLIRGQVSRADQEETAFQLQRELDAMRQRDAEMTAKLKETQEKLRHVEEKNNPESGSPSSSLECSSDGTGVQYPSLQAELMKQKEELVQCLQEQLIGGRLRQAEMEAVIRELKSQLQDAEEEKKALRERRPEESIALLQEELAAVKLREAEATCALKELRPRIAELTAQWQKHLQEYHSEPVKDGEANQSNSTPKKLMFWENNDAKRAAKAEEELVTTKLREVEAVAELKELRLRVMELETQNQVLLNASRRQDEEMRTLQSRVEDYERLEKEFLQKTRDHDRKYSDLELKMKDELMMARFREAESAQSLAELTQKVAMLEFQNQELVAQGKLCSVDDSDRYRDLQDRVVDLKAELLTPTTPDIEGWRLVVSKDWST
ncbi:ecotropic viral integration site 5 ortholog-like [Artemia franciscana]|uniref:ecotropic viral integration site 5 ortholog-like n=2 Tax=Artemia franciscana TaxID=6661 RepID=UPI0032DA11E9